MTVPDSAAPFDATAYQQAEENQCTCGAAGSGEGHTRWCPWLRSDWHKRGLQHRADSAAPERVSDSLLARIMAHVEDERRGYSNLTYATDSVTRSINTAKAAAMFELGEWLRALDKSQKETGHG